MCRSHPSHRNPVALPLPLSADVRAMISIGLGSGSHDFTTFYRDEVFAPVADEPVALPVTLAHVQQASHLVRLAPGALRGLVGGELMRAGGSRHECASIGFPVSRKMPGCAQMLNRVGERLDRLKGCKEMDTGAVSAAFHARVRVERSGGAPLDQPTWDR